MISTWAFLVPHIANIFLKNKKESSFKVAIQNNKYVKFIRGHTLFSSENK